jgi:AraC family transcriptional regulator
MQNLVISSSYPATTLAGQSALDPGALALIREEAGWRVLPGPSAKGDEVSIARWSGLSSPPLEVCHETPADCHIAGIALRNTNLRYVLNGRAVHDGPLAAGAFHVTEPGRHAQCLFRGTYDAVHLFLPARLVEECAEDLLGRRSPGWAPRPFQDPIIAHLARSLVASSLDNCRELRDHIAMAMVTRLLLSTRPANQRPGPDGGGLPQWRLRRAIDYIEANLDQLVTLAGIASAAGLSRMHFAAQFRKSVGQAPHQYLLARRIERAQEMLVRTDLPIVEIALSVGFQAQSHFTTIFKRITGQPPHAWRQAQAMSGRGRSS